MPSLHNVRTAVVPHVGLGRRVSERPQNRTRCFTICHAGNLSSERDPDVFFDGVARFVAHAKPEHRISIDLIGANPESLFQKARNRGVEQFLRLLPGRPYAETLREICTADVVILIEAPCAEGIFLPSKLVDYAQAGRPILAISPRAGTVRDLLDETGAGIAVDCLSPVEVAQGIGNMYHSFKAGTLGTEFPTERLWNRFAPEAVAELYEDLVAELRS
jgi:glycosyltransferase involved in cell wall biosynthesis